MPLAASTSMGMHPSYTLGFPRIKAVYRRTLRTHQFIGKEVILFFIHRTVDIVAVLYRTWTLQSIVPCQGFPASLWGRSIKETQTAAAEPLNLFRKGL